MASPGDPGRRLPPEAVPRSPTQGFLRAVPRGQLRKQGVDLPRSGNRLPHIRSRCVRGRRRPRSRNCPIGWRRPIVPAEATVGVDQRVSERESHGPRARRIAAPPGLPGVSAIAAFELHGPHGRAHSRHGLGEPRPAPCWGRSRWKRTAAPISPLPARRELYFQALDQNGLAVTSMRSGTQFQPGEHASCLGCHEPLHRASSAAASRWPPPPALAPCKATWTAPTLSVTRAWCSPCSTSTASPVTRRTPARRLALDSRPVDFKPGWRPTTYYASYLSLTPKYRALPTTAHRGWNDPKFYETTPGQFGAPVPRSSTRCSRKGITT